MRPIAALICLVAAASGSIVDDIRSIALLHQEGLLTNTEYAAAKQRVLASAFPPPSPLSGHNSTSAPYLMIDCAADFSTNLYKVFTVGIPKFTTPIDIRRLCPDVVGFSGDTVQTRPIHIPE